MAAPLVRSVWIGGGRPVREFELRTAEDVAELPEIDIYEAVDLIHVAIRVGNDVVARSVYRLLDDDDAATAATDLLDYYDIDEEVHRRVQGIVGDPQPITSSAAMSK